MTNSKHLEIEKETFIQAMNSIIDSLDVEEEIKEGRPPLPKKDILKSLLIMSYHSFSYRRSLTDIRELHKKGLILNMPNRASMNRLMNNSKLVQDLQNLIQITSTYILDWLDSTIIFDSTSFGRMLRLSEVKYAKAINIGSLYRTKKLHIAIAKNSKAIVCARASNGTVHDSSYFKELLFDLIKAKFPIKVLLGDSAYNSKEHYSLCEENDIQAFLDFKKNAVVDRSKGFLRKKQFQLYTNEPAEWFKFYSARTLIEITFSSIKRKGISFLRSRKDISQSNEMLLKALWYNFCLIAKNAIKFRDNYSLKE